MENILQATEAGKELAKAVDLAYQENKDREVTLQVECKTKAEADKIINEVLMTAKLEEVAELIPKKAFFLVRPSLGSLFYAVFPKRPEAYSLESKWDSSILTLYFVIYGESLDFRWQYEYNKYAKKNLQALLTRVEKLKEEDRALEVASWIVENIEVKLGVASDEVAVSQKAIWNGTAAGDDEVLAEAFLFYASLVGVDTDHYMFPKEIENWEQGKKPFFWNVVRIAGKEYYLDMVKMSEIKQQDISISSSECLMLPKEKVEWLGEYQAWTPLWRDHLPFSEVSPV